MPLIGGGAASASSATRSTGRQSVSPERRTRVPGGSRPLAELLADDGKSGGAGTRAVGQAHVPEVFDVGHGLWSVRPGEGRNANHCSIALPHPIIRGTTAPINRKSRIEAIWAALRPFRSACLARKGGVRVPCVLWSAAARRRFGCFRWLWMRRGHDPERGKEPKAASGRRTPKHARQEVDRDAQPAPFPPPARRTLVPRGGGSAFSGAERALQHQGSRRWRSVRSLAAATSRNGRERHFASSTTPTRPSWPSCSSRWRCCRRSSGRGLVRPQGAMALVSLYWVFRLVEDRRAVPRRGPRLSPSCSASSRSSMTSTTATSTCSSSFW